MRQTTTVAMALTLMISGGAAWAEAARAEAPQARGGDRASPFLGRVGDLHYPPAARRARITGAVLVECRITDGRTHDCRAVFESPPGWGFAEEAVRLHTNFPVPRTSGPRGFFTVPFCFDDATCEAQRAVTAQARRDYLARETAATG